MANSIWTAGALPPPEGVTPNFVNPQNNTTNTIALHTTCLTLVTLTVGMRLYTRRFINRKLGLDDLFCVLAFIFAIAFSAILIVADTKGLGRHIWDLHPAQLLAAVEMVTIAEYVYFVVAALIKISVLLFYRRIFGISRRTMFFVWTGVAFVSAAYLAIFLATILQCSPVAKQWNHSLPGQCFPPQLLLYLSGAINVATDLYVVILPIPNIWRLNMKLRRKLRTLAVFGLGIFVVATSIVRLGLTPTIYKSQDVTWNIALLQIWGVLEVDVGIICSCLMALPAFLDRYWPKQVTALFYRLKSSASPSSKKVEALRKPARKITQFFRGSRESSQPQSSSDEATLQGSAYSKQPSATSATAEKLERRFPTTFYRSTATNDEETMVDLEQGLGPMPELATHYPKSTAGWEGSPGPIGEHAMQYSRASASRRDETESSYGSRLNYSRPM